MLVREAGLNVVLDSVEPKPYRIGFNGNDETELDVTSLDDLEQLWASLAAEFGSTIDGVDYVERAERS